MSKYQIWIKGKEDMGLVKEYPFKLQAYIWCWLNGYVISMGRYGYALNGRVEIQEVEE